MNIATLILAHDRFDELRLLVDSIKQDFRVYIHLDASAKLPAGASFNEVNVRSIRKYPIAWGDENMIYAILDLLRMAYDDDCDYFMLISGADLPARQPYSILRDIQRNPETNYLDHARLPRADWPLSGGLGRMTLWWEPLHNRENPTLINRAYALLRKIQTSLGRKRRLLPMKYYGGSTWFNISRQTARYILDYTENNPEYLRQFRYTRNADEIFFHTLIMNSVYKKNTVNDDKRYIDWASGPERPRVLRMEDYNNIIRSGDFFARKFNPDVDSEVIRRVRRFTTPSRLISKTDTNA